MTANPQFYDVTVIAGVAAMAALANSGTLVIMAGTQPALDGTPTGTVLATLTFGATAFGTPTASSGTVTANANTIGSATIANTGTAAYFVVYESNGTTVVGTGTVGTSAADLIVSSTSFVAGGTASCSAFSITQPQT